MARRTFGTRARRGAAAPAAIKFKTPVLDTAGLRTAYDWMVVDKDLGFRLAFEWYAANVPILLIGDPLDATRQKAYDRGTLCQKQGEGTPYEVEKFHALTMAIHKYEEVWSNKGLPKINDALAATTPSTHISNVQTVLTNLNGAFEKFGVTFKLTFGSDRVFQAGAILLPATEVDQMIGQPPLKTILGETITVAKVASIIRNDEGKESLDGGKFMQNLPAVLESVNDWAAGLGGILNKPVGKAPTASKAPKTPKTPSQRPTPSPASRIRVPARDPWMIFKNDTVKAAIAQELSSKKFVDIVTLQGLCSTYGVSNGMVNIAIKDLEKKARLKFEYGPGKKSLRVL